MAQIKDRYANALLRISLENDTIEDDLEQAVLIRDTVDDDDVQDFLVHPNIPDSAKCKFFQNVYKEKISKHMMGFLYLMIRKNREKHIVPALTEYIELANRHIGKVEAKVVSAKPLTQKQLDSIATLLSKSLDVTVTIDAQVDPDVIGGLYILVEGYIFDGTVRSQINKVKNRIYHGNVFAKVISAKPLTEEQVETITGILSRKVNMKVHLTIDIDPDVIGGFIVLLEGRVFDGTIKSALNKMKIQLKGGNLNGE